MLLAQHIEYPNSIFFSNYIILQPNCFAWLWQHKLVVQAGELSANLRHMFWTSSQLSSFWAEFFNLLEINLNLLAPKAPEVCLLGIANDFVQRTYSCIMFCLLFSMTGKLLLHLHYSMFVIGWTHLAYIEDHLYRSSLPKKIYQGMAALVRYFSLLDGWLYHLAIIYVMFFFIIWSLHSYMIL